MRDLEYLYGVCGAGLEVNGIYFGGHGVGWMRLAAKVV